MRQRVALARLTSSLRRSYLWVALACFVVVLILRRYGEWQRHEAWVVAGMIGLWGLSALIAAWWRLPKTSVALRLLDQRGGWKDCFSSAWEFSHRTVLSDAEALHLTRADSHLDEARAKIPLVFPLTKVGQIWIAPLLVLLFALTPWGRVSPDARDLALTQEMQETAAAQAEALRQEVDRMREMASFTEEERSALESLLTEVNAIADTLASAEGMTAGEVLSALDERARAAERLAEKLNPFNDDWASPALLAEMATHPDMADLSLWIADKDAAGAAQESRKLSDALDDDGITSETQARFTRALEEISNAALPEDQTRPVGERVGNASRKMLEAQAKPAAREFGALAKHFEELAAREVAKKKLESLAENLREAGGEIGDSELKKMESLAESSGPAHTSPEGLKRIDEDTFPENSLENTGNQLGQSLAMGSPPKEAGPRPGEASQTPNAPEGSPPPVPGGAEGQGDSGEGSPQGEQQFKAPIPGEKGPDDQSGAGLGMSEEARDGKGKGKGGMLSAPIPGMDPGQSAPGAGLAMGDGQSNQSGQGGDQAGTASAAMNESESADPLKASGEAKVVAQSGSEGESTIRAVEGDVRQESATRTKQEIITDFISVEEQALDEQSLPLSRKRHVLKYFSAIREQFETEDTK